MRHFGVVRRKAGESQEEIAVEAILSRLVSGEVSQNEAVRSILSLVRQARNFARIEGADDIVQLMGDFEAGLLVTGDTEVRSISDFLTCAGINE